MKLAIALILAGGVNVSLFVFCERENRNEIEYRFRMKNEEFVFEVNRIYFSLAIQVE